MKVCENCGEAKPIKAKGLCNACYLYLSKHGKPRPADVRRESVYLCTTCSNCGAQNTTCIHGLCRACYWYHRRNGKHRTKLTSPYRGTTVCRNCGAEGHRANGLCDNCYNFLRRTGKMRTEADMRGKVEGMCCNCNQSPALAKGLCNACYDYKRRNGKDRPRRLYVHHERCKNCDIPLTGESDRTRRTKNLCRVCYDYQRRKGTPRPSHLWGKGAHGWCDCGQPANNIISVKIRNHIDTIPVCDACHAEEMRQRAWYGDNTVQKGADLQCKR